MFTLTAPDNTVSNAAYAVRCLTLQIFEVELFLNVLL